MSDAHLIRLTKQLLICIYPDRTHLNQLLDDLFHRQSSGDDVSSVKNTGSVGLIFSSVNLNCGDTAGLAPFRSFFLALASPVLQLTDLFIHVELMNLRFSNVIKSCTSEA